MCISIYTYIYIYIYIFSDKQQLSHKIGWPLTHMLLFFFVVFNKLFLLKKPFVLTKGIGASKAFPRYVVDGCREATSGITKLACLELSGCNVERWAPASDERCLAYGFCAHHCTASPPI